MFCVVRTNVEELRIKPAGDSSEDVLNMTSAPYLSTGTSSDHYTNPILYVDDASFLNDSTVSLPVLNATEWGWMPSTETCIYVYIGLILTIIFLTVLTVISFFTMCTRASVRLHDSMFASITHATMWFFNNHPSGKRNVRPKIIDSYIRCSLFFYSILLNFFFNFLNFVLLQSVTQYNLSLI
jgi:hypothetical protein